MSNYFLDSSALLKRYISEIGSIWIQNLVNNPANGILVAQITSIELISGVVRRTREGSISVRHSQSIQKLIISHTTNDYFVIHLRTAIVKTAHKLLNAHSLRAYDSVQLATAIEFNSQLVQNGHSPIVFVAADNRLLVAANSEGLNTDNPNNYP